MLEIIPFDIFVYILEYIDVKDVLTLQRCNTTLYTYANDNYVYDMLKNRYYPGIEYNEAFNYKELSEKQKFARLFIFYSQQISYLRFYVQQCKYAIPECILNYLMRRTSDNPVIILGEPVSASLHGNIYCVTKPDLEKIPIKLKPGDLIYTPDYSDPHITCNMLRYDQIAGISFKYIGSNVLHGFNSARISSFYKLGDYGLEFLRTVLINGYNQIDISVSEIIYNRIIDKIRETKARSVINVSIITINIGDEHTPQLLTVRHLYGECLGDSMLEINTVYNMFISVHYEPCVLYVL